MGKQGKQWETLFSWAPKSLQMVTAAMKLQDACSLEEKLWQTNTVQHVEKQRHYFAYKGLSSQSYGFFSSHVWMWELDHKEGWAPKNWCFWTVVLEKTLESPLDCKEIKPVNPEGNQSWIFVGRTGAEAEAQYLGPVMQRADSLEKTLMLGKIEGAGGEGDDKRWDVWMASLTQWTWVWASSGRPWRTEKPGNLQPMGSQSWTRLNDWTTTTKFSARSMCYLYNQKYNKHLKIAILDSHLLLMKRWISSV